MRAPVWIPEDAPPYFPDPLEFDSEGLVAGGGDLSLVRLLAAYRRGLFPWYDEPPILWWCPDPRSVITPTSLHISRSLHRALKKTPFTVTCGRSLKGVMAACAERREGTWLSSEMQKAYSQLGENGFALSYEVWLDETLVGGLYGVLIGGLFAAESKFHRKTDASKIALVCAVTDLFARGVSLFDVQFTTNHLRTLGVHEISRETYIRRLEKAVNSKLTEQLSPPDLLPRVRDLLQISSPGPEISKEPA